MKVLVVEDNATNRVLLERRLHKKNHEVIVAENGKIGVEMAATEQPDIILMDMRMPVMNGCEATKAIKANRDLKQIPVIGLSANAREEDFAHALACGCDSYATKPINFDSLFQTMDTALNSKKNSA